MAHGRANTRQILTTQDVCALLDVCPLTVRKYVYRGLLVPIGGVRRRGRGRGPSLRFTQEALAEFESGGVRL